MVEEFLGRLERDGFLADRLEAPMLDQLEAVPPTEDGAWLFPLSLGGQNAALVAWWFGGALRNLSFVTLPAAGDRAKELKDQLAHLAMAGELEGWLTAPPKWHLVADPVNATEWESILRGAIERAGAGHRAAGAGGTGGAHGETRGGGGQIESAAGGICRALPAAVRGPAVAARPVLRGRGCMRLVW